jgi:hypothetical protein
MPFRYQDKRLAKDDDKVAVSATTSQATYIYPQQHYNYQYLSQQYQNLPIYYPAMNQFRSNPTQLNFPAYPPSYHQGPPNFYQGSHNFNGSLDQASHGIHMPYHQNEVMTGDSLRGQQFHNPRQSTHTGFKSKFDHRVEVPVQSFSFCVQ